MEKEKEELFIPKTKHKALKIILAIILLAGLCVGAYLLYQDKFNNPKAIVKTALSKSINEYKNSMSMEEDIKKYKYNGLIKFDANLGNDLSDMMEIIKNIDLQFSGETDLNNSINNMSISSRYKNEKLIDFKTFFEKDNMYLLLVDIYDKYIKLNDNVEKEDLIMDDIPIIEFNPNDTNIIMNSVNKSFTNVIDELDFKKESTTITINNKEIDVLNNYVILKNNEVYTIIKKTLNNLLNDNEFITVLKRLTNDDNIKDTLKNRLNDFDNTPFTGTYRINFYTDKGLFNKKLISIRQEISQSGITSSINIDKLDDDEYIFSVNSLGTSYSIKIKKNSSNFNIGIKIKIMEMFINVEASINYEEIDEVTKPEIIDFKNIDDLDEKDIQNIDDAISKNEALKMLIEEIEKLSKPKETE